MSSGREVLTRAEVMDGIAEMIPDVQIEATHLPGRAQLVTLRPRRSSTGWAGVELELNADRSADEPTSTNVADRPIQIGCHIQ